MTDDYREIESGIEDTVTYRRVYNKARRWRLIGWIVLAAASTSTLAVLSMRWWGWREVAMCGALVLSAIAILQCIRHWEARL